MPHSSSIGHGTTATGETRHYIHLSDLESRTYTTYMIASARLYHTPFGAANDDWTYSQLRGLLVFGRDRSTVKNDHNSPSDTKLWFRLVDSATGRTVWMFKVTPGMDYQQEKPFFHTFPGKSRMFGFRFDEDDDAAEFYQRLNDKASIKSNTKANKNTKKRKPSLSRKSPISVSMISAPAVGSFVHAAHVGINQEGNMEASGILDSSWNEVIGDLRDHGISERMVEENTDFIQGFLAGYKAASARGNSTSDDEREFQLFSLAQTTMADSQQPPTVTRARASEPVTSGQEPTSKVLNDI